MKGATYEKLLKENPAVILSQNLRTKSGVTNDDSYNWVDLRKKLINADGKYSFEANKETNPVRSIYFPQASASPVGNRFYVKHKEFEAFCKEQAEKFFDEVKALSPAKYILGWSLRRDNMVSVHHYPQYQFFKAGSRLMGYPLNDYRSIQQAYVLQMGDPAMTLRTEFANKVIGTFTPEGFTSETITLAGIFYWLAYNNRDSGLYSHIFDSIHQDMFQFDFEYDVGCPDTMHNLKLIHKEYETLVRLHTLMAKTCTKRFKVPASAHRELYLRAFEILHDRASRVADSLLVGVYKPHQSGFKNVCMIINQGNYDLEQAIEIAIEAFLLNYGD